jgi:hypothetical protein
MISTRTPVSETCLAESPSHRLSSLQLGGDGYQRARCCRPGRFLDIRG